MNSTPAFNVNINKLKLRALSTSAQFPRPIGTLSIIRAFMYTITYVLVSILSTDTEL